MHKITHVQLIKTGLSSTCRSVIMASAVAAGLLAGGFSIANDAAITEVDIKPAGDRMYQVSITLEHADTGWDHYADGWEVIDAEGNRLGVRPLAHPHENEQPFTRSQSGIVIPEGTTEVYIRTRDNVDGWFEERTPVTLP